MVLWIIPSKHNDPPDVFWVNLVLLGSISGVSSSVKVICFFHVQWLVLNKGYLVIFMGKYHAVFLRDEGHNQMWNNLILFVLILFQHNSIMLTSFHVRCVSYFC